jgi:hypothetical protein
VGPWEPPWPSGVMYLDTHRPGGEVRKPYHGGWRLHDCAEFRYIRPAHREYISVPGRRARRSYQRHLLGVEPNCDKNFLIGASTPRLQRRSF